jgi:hypothetical protein
MLPAIRTSTSHFEYFGREGGALKIPMIMKAVDHYLLTAGGTTTFDILELRAELETVLRIVDPPKPFEQTHPEKSPSVQSGT